MNVISGSFLVKISIQGHTFLSKNIFSSLDEISSFSEGCTSEKNNRNKVSPESSYMMKRTETAFLYDLNHNDYCHTEGFHAKIDSTCFCKICGHQMEYYHDRYCEENINRCKAATVVLKRIKIDSNKPDSSGTNYKRTRKKE